MILARIGRTVLVQAALGSFACCTLGFTLSACDSGGERPVTEESVPSNAGGAEATERDLISLPFAVDDHFFDTGFMGAAGQDSADRQVVISRPNDCEERDPSAQGACHCYEYTGGIEGFEWTGLYWLSDYDNWGVQRGALIEPGATTVSFRASSDPPGVPVEILVGDVDGENFSDQVARREPVALTEEMQLFEIDISGEDYSRGVIGGFGWLIESGEPAMLCIDDIRWH